MGIFDSIKNAIFGKANAAGLSVVPSSRENAAAEETTPKANGDSASIVNVEEVLEGIVASKGEQLNWRTSVVDLMKALDLDSSLAARRQLAKELGFQGDANNSAAMNVWLQKNLMKKLSENGGAVPPELHS
uniref:5'-nucleotidase n=1 Tax=Ochrobactrum sp. LM19 TaxID=1449781 RepID=A0A0D5A0R9_9HYPH|nr:DUF3597 domain-containing protein [Ochrobactrum sp. LM19]AJW29900.1 5'-nucleotidase [Ochrobactrum sp. LM19]